MRRRALLSMVTLQNSLGKFSSLATDFNVSMQSCKGGMHAQRDWNAWHL